MPHTIPHGLWYVGNFYMQFVPVEGKSYSCGEYYQTYICILRECRRHDAHHHIIGLTSHIPPPDARKGVRALLKILPMAWPHLTQALMI